MDILSPINIEDVTFGKVTFKFEEQASPEIMGTLCKHLFLYVENLHNHIPAKVNHIEWVVDVCNCWSDQTGFIVGIKVSRETSRGHYSGKSISKKSIDGIVCIADDGYYRCIDADLSYAFERISLIESIDDTLNRIK